METGSGVEPRITKSCFPARVKKHGCQAYTVASGTLECIWWMCYAELMYELLSWRVWIPLGKL